MVLGSRQGGRQGPGAPRWAHSLTPTLTPIHWAAAIIGPHLSFLGATSTTLSFFFFLSYNCVLQKDGGKRNFKWGCWARASVSSKGDVRTGDPPKIVTMLLLGGLLVGCWEFTWELWKVWTWCKTVGSDERWRFISEAHLLPRPVFMEPSPKLSPQFV